MPKAHNPRHGSMQYWPRKRARRQYARVRTWTPTKDALPLGFAGYKVGMTHLGMMEEIKGKKKKILEASIPVTVIECPPLKIIGLVGYKETAYGKKAATAVLTKGSKELARKLCVPKKETGASQVTAEGLCAIKLLVATQPKLATVNKKKPEVFEMGIGGKVEEQLAYAKENLGKEIAVEEVFKEGQQIDVHGVTKGKGLQGPVKRFGVSLRAKKSEKTKRGPGSLGPWKGQQHVMYRIAFAGQTGYHQRKELNKWLIMLGKDPEKVNPKGGFKQYGVVKNPYMLVKGSVHGPAKRVLIFSHASRANKHFPNKVPPIDWISTASKQGR
jgi:large subunit ribosomal protein L3